MWLAWTENLNSIKLKQNPSPKGSCYSSWFLATNVDWLSLHGGHLKCLFKTKQNHPADPTSALEKALFHPSSLTVQCPIVPVPPPHHFVDDTHCCMPMLSSDFGKIQKPRKNLRNTNLPLRLLAYTQPWWVIPGCLLALNVGMLLRTAQGHTADNWAC